MSIIHYLKLRKYAILSTIGIIVLYLSFAYDLERTDFIKLLSLWTGSFVLTYTLYRKSKGDFNFLFGTGILFRILFLFAIPNLSQDFYRFVWDGRLLLEGYNPYLYVPDNLIAENGEIIAQAEGIHRGMGALSAGHFTNYPPLNQLCFALAAIFAGKNILGSVIVFRIIIILADIGILFFGKKLLEHLKLPVSNIFWYFLNPFIIVELTGNLHFEGVMLCFMVWSFYLLVKGKWQWSAVTLACSISVKLMPLLFLPLFYQYFVKKQYLIPACPAGKPNPSPQGERSHDGLKKLIGFYVVVGVTTLLLFLPFFDLQFINNYSETVGLWFTNFEFNGSLYYVAREIGYGFRGYNEIQTIGQYTPFIVIFFVLAVAFFRKNKTAIQLITAMLLCLSFYYFVSTTVHPWYLATLLILSIFTKFRFPLVWSLVIILSYLAYGNEGNKENLWIIASEYSIVYGVFFWELFFKKRTSTSSLSLES
ncbi:mannosyltransferase [Sungkyunkwania multivorans]|uniref:Mannosyltransferase n=1 Tax=Sungkyunkwania multivorans TaxID=1173618 RepID=A0ABW3D3I2_9FLAO